MRSLFMLLLLCALPVGARALEDPDTEVAKKHFEAGRGFYDAGDYAKALDEFLAARRSKPAPAFDFNIARCLDRLERYHEAIAEYEAYLTHSHKAPDADEVRTRINVLRQRLDEIDKQQRHPTVPPVVPPKPDTTPKPDTLETPPTLIPPPSLLDTPADRAIKTEVPLVELEREKTKRKRTIAIVVGTVVGVVLVATGVTLALVLSQSSTPSYTMTTLGNVPSTR